MCARCTSLLYRASDYFLTDGLAINGIIVALADAFYEAAIDNGQLGLPQHLQVSS